MKLLSQEVQETAFHIAPYEKEGGYDVTDKDRVVIAQQYELAFRTLQTMFNTFSREKIQ